MRQRISYFKYIYFSILKPMCKALFSFVPPKKKAHIIYKSFAKSSRRRLVIIRPLLYAVGL